MSQKIEVCGKMLTVGNVYFFYGDTNFWQLGVFGSDGFYSTLSWLVCLKENVKCIKPVNGEVLEDAPFKPKDGDVCVFSNYKDFSNWHVTEYLIFNGKHHCAKSTTPFIYCKPFDPDNPPWGKS